MTFAVRYTARAWAEAEAAFEWIYERSPTAAKRWYKGLMSAIDTLEKNPARFSLAPEDEWYPGELRQLLFGKRRGVYRVLFEIRGSTVYILRVRHGAQALLHPEDF
jgi:plasmid stabilization system protein ParE